MSSFSPGMPKGWTGVLDVWGRGQLLAFSGVDGRTDQTGGLVLRTQTPGVALDVKQPGLGSIRISDDDRPEKLLLTSDCFVMAVGGATVRAGVVDAHHVLFEGPIRLGSAGSELAIRQAGARTLLGVREKIDPSLLDCDLDELIARRLAWWGGLPMPQGLDDSCRRALAKALSIMKGQVYAPEGRIRRRWTTPDRWPHRDMWLWDSAFHAIGWRHVDGTLAREMLEAVFDCQRDDGMIPHQSGPGVIFASLIIAAIPTLLIFAFCQKIIMRGIVVPVEK